MKRWIECTVKDGMFPDETAVSIKCTSITVSMFMVDDHPALRGSALEVEVIEQDNSHALVVLPQPSIELGAIVKVDNSIFIKEQ